MGVKNICRNSVLRKEVSDMTVDMVDVKILSSLFAIVFLFGGFVWGFCKVLKAERENRGIKLSDFCKF